MRLTYENAYGNDRRYHAEPYFVDHLKGGQKFREPYNGVVVYENNVVEIRQDMFRNPEVREALLKRFGIHIAPIRGVAGVKYFLPSGEQLTRDEITEKNDTLLYDFAAMRAVKPRYGHPVRYYGEHAVPMGGEAIKVVRLDKAELRKVTKQVQPLLGLALTTRMLHDEFRPTTVHGLFKAIVERRHLTDFMAMFTLDELCAIGRTVEAGTWKYFLREAMKRLVLAPYLRIERR